mmetsp:Transcript_36899/g.85101  ORF Transcript_36899/g.85101 Transcript_36899/m.85101 type:complete len:210 (+) Transcript_36899:1360-1989(+)
MALFASICFFSCMEASSRLPSSACKASCNFCTLSSIAEHLAKCSFATGMSFPTAFCESSILLCTWSSRRSIELLSLSCKLQRDADRERSCSENASCSCSLATALPPRSVSFDVKSVMVVCDRTCTAARASLNPWTWSLKLWKSNRDFLASSVSCSAPNLSSTHCKSLACSVSLDLTTTCRSAMRPFISDLKWPTSVFTAACIFERFSPC